MTEIIGATARLNRVCLLSAAVIFFLAGCGDSDEETSDGTSESSASSGVSSSGSSGSGVSKTVPTISGKPASEVPVGATYSFTPVASDADGDTLTFKISNKPAWATFSTSTGRLSGKPAAGDVNNYTGIRITVSDGTNSVDMPVFSVNVVTLGNGTATLSWSAPSENMDGSSLDDLAGYKIYWGLSPRNYDFSATLNGTGALNYVVDSLTNATWYFSVTAFNADEIESSFSNEVTKTIQ